MSSDFANLITRLTRNDVNFIIIGGFAGVIYGCTIVTQDIDICCEFSTENLSKLYKAVKDLNPVHRMTPRRVPFDLNLQDSANLKNLYLDTDLGQLDCLSLVKGIGDFSEAQKRSTKVTLEDCDIKVLNIDALIESKKSLNRPRDIEAVHQLKTIKRLKGK